MNKFSTVPPKSPQGESRVSSYLAQPHPRNQSPRGLAWILQLWYRFTSPPEPGDSASFQMRELFRRGRTGSQITIVLYLLLLTSFPAAFAGSNPLLVVILILDLCILTLAMVLNRFRKVSIAGI